MNGANDKTSDRIQASAFVICKDEVDCIADCLRALETFADIVVVDSGSTDGTLDIVSQLASQGLPIRLFRRDWPGYGAQKQFALEQCLFDWCLNVDADEIVDADLGNAIAAVIMSDSASAGYSVRRRNWIAGYGYAHRWVAPEWILRLVRRQSARYDTQQIIHESLLVSGCVSRLEAGFLLHRDDIDLHGGFEKQNSYTTIKVEQNIARGRAAKPWKLLFSPLGYFVKFYFLKRYIVCGWAGFAHAAGAAFYSFQTEYKHWLASRHGARLK